MTDKMGMECPGCCAMLRFTLEDAARQPTVRCSRGHSVKLKNEGSGARKATQALSDFDRTLKRLGR